jgi:hypothetical protein
MGRAVLARYETVLRTEPLRWNDWTTGQLEKVASGSTRSSGAAAVFGDRIDLGTRSRWAARWAISTFRYASARVARETSECRVVVRAISAARRVDGGDAADRVARRGPCTGGSPSARRTLSSVGFVVASSRGVGVQHVHHVAPASFRAHAIACSTVIARPSCHAESNAASLLRAARAAAMCRS